MKGRYLAFFAIVLLLGPAFADDQNKIASQWREIEITIDGSSAEWSNSLSYLEKEKLSFGMKNDTSHLYLCLKFDPQIRRQALMFGFTIWFDPAGKNNKTFGIRFPIGMQNVDGETEYPMMPPMMPSEAGPETVSEAMRQMLREIEVLGPDRDDRNRFAATSTFGVQFAASYSSSELVCELRVPLKRAKGRPYAVEADAGQAIGVGFEMGEFDREKMRMRRRGGAPFGGGMGRGGMPPGGRPPGDTRMPGPFKIWTVVTLAAGPPVSQ